MAPMVFGFYCRVDVAGLCPAEVGFELFAIVVRCVKKQEFAAGLLPFDPFGPKGSV